MLNRQRRYKAIVWAARRYALPAAARVQQPRFDIRALRRHQHVQRRKSGMQLGGLCRLSGALQEFLQHHRSEGKGFFLQAGIQRARRGGFASAQPVDPDRSVNENHGSCPSARHAHRSRVQ